MVYVCSNNHYVMCFIRKPFPVFSQWLIIWCINKRSRKYIWWPYKHNLLCMVIICISQLSEVHTSRKISPAFGRKSVVSVERNLKSLWSRVWQMITFRWKETVDFWQMITFRWKETVDFLNVLLDGSLWMITKTFKIWLVTEMLYLYLIKDYWTSVILYGTNH